MRRRTLMGGALAAAGVTGLPAAAVAATDRPDESLVLWYDEPATDWESRALPVGNGALGAMVFGEVGTERIQFTEKTLWTGGPGEGPGYTGGNWTAPRPGALAEARRLILDQGAQPPETIAALLGQPKTGYGSYQPFGDLYLDSDVPSDVTGYRRELDLGRAVARVTYRHGGVTYTREVFASHPDGVVVVRLGADRPGQITATVRLACPHPDTATAVADGRFTLAGKLSNGMRMEAQVAVRAEGGSRVSAPDRVTVTGADAVTVLLAAGTDYAHRYPDYRGPAPGPRVRTTLDAAARRPYPRLLDRHIADHRGLFDRVRLDLGQRPSAVPTDELLASYTGGSSPSDRALEALFFAYGRYLLIASSRPGTLPANLQGVWNSDTSAAWSGDYHTNINLQMNYWPAEVTNLAETTGPLVDFVDGLRPRGRESARIIYGARGWVVSNETNAFDFTGVHDWPTAFWFPEAGAWLTRHLWEHYLFTGDREFLRRTGYPIMREAAEFWLDYLVTDPHDGTLVAVPSYSPEHGPFTAGAAMSQQIVWDLFRNVLAAASVLGDDPSFAVRVRDTLARLDPGLRVGSWGQLQEWKADLDDPADTHRHVSHLYGLYPGAQISPLTTPEYARAARVSLLAREGDGTGWAPGWSRAWKAAFWARLLDGDRAFAALRDQLRFQTLANLWDTHPPFQIDGNFGATAVVAEMLVQSHAGVVHVLPALPSAWGSGSVDGLRARGAFTVGATWRSGRATEIRLGSDNGGPVRLTSTLLTGRFTVVDNRDGRRVDAYREGADVVRLDTRAGHGYRLVSS
ncbi:glycosyl hydrolase family 95 catalytic domain-containing protein [Planosporangium sp. 12N6]|uniref:glycoside hydrolase family 95 protein n=1 Tax=Planosporangium spinosum TaxID=3402278 RepID=UPI003CEEC0F7